MNCGRKIDLYKTSEIKKNGNFYYPVFERGRLKAVKNVETVIFTCIERIKE